MNHRRSRALSIKVKCKDGELRASLRGDGNYGGCIAFSVDDWPHLTINQAERLIGFIRDAIDEAKARQQGLAELIRYLKPDQSDEEGPSP